MNPSNAIMIGIDPAAFAGALKLRFLSGSAEEARQALPQRGCVVAASWARRTKLGVGDTFQALPPAGGEPVTYTIAGVVELRGWHWMTKFSGLRRRSVRAGALVFADYETVRRDYGLERVNFLWANLAEGASVDELLAGLLPIAERNLGERAPVNGQGTWEPYALTRGNSLRVTTPQLIHRMIGARSDDVIWGMSQVPLITLLIAGLAVLNTLLASVRARRWDLGVLRAIGVSRGALARLILAEGLLVGLVACQLGLLSGLSAGWCGAVVSSQIGRWGGMEAQAVFPLAKLAPGLLLTLGLCALAALWPALRIGRADVLGLLQAGRGGD